MKKYAPNYSKENIIKLFAEAQEKCQQIQQQKSTHNPDVLADLGERLSLLKWIFLRIWNLEEIQWASSVNVKVDDTGFPVPMTREEFEAHDMYVKEERILTESFYYLSWRITSILNHYKPGFVKQVSAVDYVRNKLIEHPWDADSKVFINSFSCCGPVGPVIKSIRPNHQVGIYADNGLWPNLIQFLNALKSIQ